MKLKNMTLKNITEACNGSYVGDDSILNEEISGVEKDSRLIKEGYLYLQTQSFNVLATTWCIPGLPLAVGGPS